MEHSGRSAFRDALARPANLVDAALAVAQEDLDLPDTHATLAGIHTIAQRAQKSIGPVAPTLQGAEQLIRHLHGSEGFTGNTDDYDDPANSYLPLVLQRRIGLPISLTILLLTVGEALGIPLEPAALPAHFMARWQLPDGDLFLDLFWGQVLDAHSCRVFLQEQTGSILPSPDLFPAATATEVVVRLLRNLKHSHVHRNAWPQALAATERILIAQPGSLEDRRDRGFLRIRVGDLHGGLADLESYSRQTPTAADHTLLQAQARNVSELIGDGSHG